MRVEAGAVVDEFDLPGIGHVVARHTRTKAPDGGVTWACMFTIAAVGANDLAVVHRLSAPSLYEGRRSVRHAVEFLAGRAFGASAAALREGDRRADGADAPDAEAAGGAARTDDDHGWRPPASRRILSGRKRPFDRRVALSPTRGHGRRADDRGIVPDLSLLGPRRVDPNADAAERPLTDPVDGGERPSPAPDPQPSPLS